MQSLIRTHLPSVRSDSVPSSPGIHRQQWIAIAASTFSAVIASLFITLLLNFAEPHSAAATLLVAIAAVTNAALAGVFGVWLAQITLTDDLPTDSHQISLAATTAWLFFPGILILALHFSPFILLPTILATTATTLRLRKLFPPDLTLPSPPQPELPSLYGLPPADSKPLQSFVAAICAQATLFALFKNLPLLAAILLAITLALPLWRWGAYARQTVTVASSRGFLSFIAIIAVFLTLLELTAASSSGYGIFGGNPDKPTHAATATDKTRDPRRNYVSIILYPPPAKHTEITPPNPKSFLGQVHATSKSIVIPFDGPYWYFQYPAIQPGADAHIANGKPTAVNVNTTNLLPLAMEAHQNLAVPIDLTCCRAIDVTLTNADTRPGPITLNLLLSDSTTQPARVLNLGQDPILSSTETAIPLSREPVRETLRFTIPQSTPITRFDRITIVFLPSVIRSRVGAKVSIESLTLVP